MYIRVLEIKACCKRYIFNYTVGVISWSLIEDNVRTMASNQNISALYIM